ncbi:DUF3224 domain-containing protein [Alteromonas lipolytica]|uniref:DUF3224 domain-containing protein n=1 Tax=Alteromonas lipolytica TaxID=1856405 RepID=A0A1E8FI23_9ALTE|nr:DUF3224 domain-containing protein [Alteromonas lipolytica]OFI35590.1 hypothetical protein BFC17_12600 [Alteromonas lipolytica]GGF77441.1 hypothetical protein GCM10011338_32220 [Alteromonas lipolytica]
MQRVLGEFAVELSPQQDELDMGRMLLRKTFSGELAGTSEGQMLSKRSLVQGSAGYVAIETFTGELVAKKGSFSLQHLGIMSRGEQKLTIIVVPDSATDELTGLYGNMQIQIVEGKHYYDFEFAFA